MGRTVTVVVLAAVVALAASLAACAAAAPKQPFVPPLAVLELWGEGGVATLASPAKGEGWAIGPSEPGWPPKELNGLPKGGDEHGADTPTLRELSAVCLDAATFHVPPREACFRPQAAVRFSRGDDTATVVLSFDSDEIALYRDGKLLARKDMSASHARLLVPLKRLLAGDPRIQAIR